MDIWRTNRKRYNGNYIFPIGQGLEGEHLIHINLDYKDDFVTIRDEFDWDLGCPSNEYFLFA